MKQYGSIVSFCHSREGLSGSSLGNQMMLRTEHRSNYGTLEVMDASSSRPGYVNDPRGSHQHT